LKSAKGPWGKRTKGRKIMKQKTHQGVLLGGSRQIGCSRRSMERKKRDRKLKTPPLMATRLQKGKEKKEGTSRSGTPAAFREEKITGERKRLHKPNGRRTLTKREANSEVEGEKRGKHFTGKGSKETEKIP